MFEGYRFKVQGEAPLHVAGYVVSDFVAFLNDKIRRRGAKSAGLARRAMIIRLHVENCQGQAPLFSLFLLALVVLVL